VGASEQRHGRAHDRSWLVETVAIVCLLVAFVALLAPTLDNPLLEKSAFRQTQTAYTALVFHEDGIDLLHPRLPVLGEPFEIPFEFPLFQASASLLIDLGLASDTAMRVMGLICFLATAVLLFGLVRHVAGRTAAFGSLAAFMVTPFALVWSRTSMIEYLATAGAVGFTWAYIAWRDNRRPEIGALCLVAGLVGMLVKPTTAIFWVIPAVAYRPTPPRRGDWRHRVSATALAVIPIVAATAWTAHADSIKSASATTTWLTSRALREWNFGTLDQRLDPDVWKHIAEWFLLLLIGPVGVVLLIAAAVAGWRASQRLFWIGVACAAFLPPLVFTNLYFVHDYYVAATAPAVAALVGLGASFVVERISRRPVRLAAAGVCGVLLLTVWFVAGHRYWDALEGRNEEVDTVLALAGEVDSATQPTDRVAVVGLDWNPAVLYYARRWGHMVVGDNVPFAYDLIRDNAYRHLLIAQPRETDLGFVDRWTWIGALTEHVYAIADDPSELSSAMFATTNDRAEVEAHLARSAALIAAPNRVPCGERIRIPAGSRGTWIELVDPPENALIAVPGSLGPLPARRFIFVSSELVNEGRVTITCTGADSLSIVRVRDAGPPA